MVVIALSKPLARSAAQSRSKSYAHASDAVPRLAEGDRFAAGGFLRMAASLVGHDANTSRSSLLLALRKTPLRPDRCR